MQNIAPYRELFAEMLISQNIQGGMGAIEWSINSGLPPQSILLEVISAAMDEVGQLQANREIALSEIYVIAKIAEMAVNRALALIPQNIPSAGTIVIGTVSGDHHGLGRKIVASFLRAAGFHVHDLGLNVSSVKFVETAAAVGAPIICASALLLHTAVNVKDIRQTLRDCGLENEIKLVVGGAAFNFDKELYRILGADATAVNASDAVSVVRQLMKENNPWKP